MVAKTRGGDRKSSDGSTRTTLTLDNDVLLLIRRRAEVTDESMGKVVSDLIRESPVIDDDGDKDLPPYAIPGRKGGGTGDDGDGQSTSR